MTNDVSSVLKRKKSQIPFFLTFGILFALLGVASIVLFCLYFVSLGPGLFYGLGLPLTVLLFWVSFAFCHRGFFASYLCKFFAQKKKKETNRVASLVSFFPFTADAHFESIKMKLSDGSFALWASPFGKFPFKEGVSYSLRIGDGWILGWEEEK